MSIVMKHRTQQSSSQDGSVVSSNDSFDGEAQVCLRAVLRRRSRSQIDIAIHDLASGQLGLVTASQLEGHGITASHLEQRTRQSELCRETRGVYRVLSHPRSRPQFILSRCFAIPGSVIGGIAAAVVHDLPVRASTSRSNRDGTQTVELHVGPRQSSVLPGAALRRMKEPSISVAWNGGLVTSVSETLIDLARLVDRSSLNRCLDHALVEKFVTVPSLRTSLEQKPRAINRRVLLDLLDERPTGTVRYRSRTEQRVGRWLHDEKLSPVCSNFTVPGIGIEVDFAWPTQRIALEVSPFYTHSSKEKQDRDMHRRLKLQSAGWLIVECTDRHVVSATSFSPIATHIRTLLLTR